MIQPGLQFNQGMCKDQGLNNTFLNNSLLWTSLSIRCLGCHAMLRDIPNNSCGLRVKFCLQHSLIRSYKSSVYWIAVRSSCFFWFMWSQLQHTKITAWSCKCKKAKNKTKQNKSCEQYNITTYTCRRHMLLMKSEKKNLIFSFFPHIIYTISENQT